MLHCRLIVGALLLTTVLSGQTNTSNAAGTVTVQQSTASSLKVAAADSIGQAQYNFPAGFLRTTDEPRQIAYDPFDAALDTTNFWTAPTVGNSAVLAAVSTGTMTMGTGTTASGWSKLFTIPTFKPVVPSWLGFSFAIALPDGAAPTANSYRFWGAGTIATTPTTSAPMTDAVGFELTTAGKLMAVVYAGGTRTQVADLSGAGGQVLDANMHRYIVYVRTDKAYWYIDSLATAVATSSFQSPQIQTLPLALLAVGGSTPPVSNTQIQCSGLAVWDTGKNATQISDGTFPFRKATVSAAGALNILPASGATMAVTQPTGSNLHTVVDSGTITTVSAVTGITNALPTGTNTIGSVKLTDGTTAATINSAANQAAATANGAVLTEKGARWRVSSTPAVSVVASAVKAAGGAGVRHVADCLSFSAAATTAPVLTKLNVNLRDGASGAGTIIWSFTVVVPAATGQSAGPHSICGLNLPGSAATAMTIEFSSLLTNLFEDVSLSGYDVN